MATKINTQNKPVTIGHSPYRYCSNPKAVPKILAPGIGIDRARLILTNITKWVNGTTLHYYFFDRKTDGAAVEYVDGTKGWISWKGF